MATDAMVTVLGPARAHRWACESEADYARWRAAEADRVLRIEAELTRQLERPATLGPPLVPDEASAGPVDALSLPVGPLGEGIAWIRDGAAAGRTPHLAFGRSAAGLFLPLDFPEPFIVPCGADLDEVRSIARACRELESWLAARAGDVARGVLAHARNLALVLAEACELGLAVELV